MVDVSSSKNSITITVGNTNKNNSVAITPGTANNSVTTKSDTAQYWSNVSRDYSEQAKTSAYKAEQVKNEIIIQKDSIIADIENTGVNAVDNIATIKSESIADIEAKTNEASVLIDAGIADINTVKNETIDSINNTKTGIITDIEFVADGEKEEIKDLVDAGKDEIQELTNEIKDNAEDIINRVGISMFDTVLKDYVLTYEESKGLALQGTYVYKNAVVGERYGYPDFYAKCLEEYNQATTTETVNGVTVKVHSNGHKFYDIADKTGIDEFFSTMGSAWFYGIDTANERIFLPRNNYYSLSLNKDSANVHSRTGSTVDASTVEMMPYFWPDSGALVTGADNGVVYPGIDSGGRIDRIWNDDTGSHSGAIGHSLYINSSDVVKANTDCYLYICVGNTVSDTSWVDVVTQVEGGVLDLENATNEGLSALANASNALRQTQITNCLLEVPQNIKLALVDGVLTLKAGSKVIVPNGFEEDGTTPKFDYVTVESDLTYTVTGTNNRTICYRPINNTLYGPIREESGTTATLASCAFYNTSENKINYMDSNIVASTYLMSFPICRISTVDGIITEIKDISNGMGYIGSTIWVDKGVKGLIPNGRNKDGSLKNIEVNSTQVKIITKTGTYKGIIAIGQSGSPDLYSSLTLDEETNFNKTVNGDIHFRLNVGTAEITNGVISNFQPKIPVHLVDRNELQEVQCVVETYVNGTSWYRVWSDGWCEQGGKWTGSVTIGQGSEQIVTITFLKPYKDINYHAVSETITMHCLPFRQVPAKDKIGFGFGAYEVARTLSEFTWEAKGYIA